MDNYLNNPKHWRDRAEETRTKAGEVWYDEDSRQRLLRIAQEYERLADHAAERLRSDELLEGSRR